MFWTEAACVDSDTTVAGDAFPVFNWEPCMKEAIDATGSYCPPEPVETLPLTHPKNTNIDFKSVNYSVHQSSLRKKTV